jgi:CMP-N,N'-diacetyllegionaminic acid synthase
MKDKNRYTAFVPARSGSKRLPDKNIKMLAGKPLSVWTLEEFINSEKIDEVIFSTDSMDYWKIVNEYIESDKLVLDYRTPEEAGDKVKIFDYIKNKREKIFGSRGGVFVLALPTAPLRKTCHINDAISLFEDKNKPIFSATKYDFPISFAFTVNNGHWHSVLNKNPMVTGETRSQEQQDTYHPNGAIYIRNINDLNCSTLYDGAIPFIMDHYSSVDVDTIVDFDIARAIMAGRN